MKKYAFLLLVVLGISSTAFGFCRVSGLEVGAIECGEPVTATVDICCSEECTIADEEDINVWRVGSTIYVDITLTCTSPCGGTPLTDVDLGEILGEAAGGLYIVVVRVWADYSEIQCRPYCWYTQPRFAGQTATSFRVQCEDDWPCWPSWPCRPCLCPCPTVTID